MPEITREEAKQAIAEWIEHHVFARDAFTGHEKFHDRYEAILRLALAALEDVERVDALAYDLEGGPIFDQYGERDVHMIAATDAHIETDERGAYCRAFRAAIDRARGV